MYTCISFYFYADYDGGLWVGYWDVKEEGHFVNVNTDNPLGTEPDSYSNWYGAHGEPNGDTEENCVVVQASRGTWNDAPCGEYIEKCGACRINDAPRFQIRGEKKLSFKILHYFKMILKNFILH